MKIILTCCLLWLASVGFAQQTTFELVELPYPANALEPVISEQTINLHHGKHLQGYVNNLNKLIKDTPFESMTLEEIVQKSDGALFNNAGQTLNHNLYFLQFSPNGEKIPSGKLAEAINKQWGSFDNFKAAFEQAGAGLFGSGWVWLAANPEGELIITQDANGSNPVVNGLTPLMGIDVWEHAYYLDYQNRRADHLKAVWDIIDWNVVSDRYN